MRRSRTYPWRVAHRHKFRQPLSRSQSQRGHRCIEPRDGLLILGEPDNPIEKMETEALTAATSCAGDFILGGCFLTGTTQSTLLAARAGCFRSADAGLARAAAAC